MLRSQLASLGASRLESPPVMQPHLSRRGAHLLTLVIALTLLIVSAQGRLFAQEQSAGREKDRQEITSILGRWEEAWISHDMKTFASLFHEDGVWILWTGEVWTGRQAIEEGHAAVHKTVFRNSIQRENLEELQFVGPDAAIMRFCSVLTGDERAPNDVIRSRKFVVVTRRQGGWKVSWGQNTRLASNVPDSDCFVKLRKRSDALEPDADSVPTGEALVHHPSQIHTSLDNYTQRVRPQFRADPAAQSSREVWKAANGPSGYRQL